MEPVSLLLLLLSLAVGALLGWLVRGSRESAERLRIHATATAMAAKAEGLTESLHHERAAHEAALERFRRDDGLREERERRQQTILRALAPVQETLASMQTKVDDLERERHLQYGSLAEQLRRAQESDDALRATTESLAGALRSNSARGVWGETQLRRIVESAGLTRFVDFETQASVSSDAGAGRPDLVVRLPGDRALAVDAKVPLSAYLEAAEIPVTATGEAGARRQQLLRAHVKAVRAHVDALASKTYWAGLSSSPEFVICFVPSESLLAAALEEDPALLDYAFGKRVALASPVNLWAVLKTVAYTWTQQDVSTDARRLFDLGNELYHRLGGLAGHLEDLRRALARTVDSYNRFAGSLESRVFVSARRFPGIDDTKLAALEEPGLIDSSPRTLTAPELVDRDDARAESDDERNVTEDQPLLRADVGDVRERAEGQAPEEGVVSRGRSS